MLTNEEAIYVLKNTAWLGSNEDRETTEQAVDIAIKALQQTAWIPIKYHEITESERKENGYPKDWVYFLDCEMPQDGQGILVQAKNGEIRWDVCYEDDGFSLDSGWDWKDDIIACLPLPEPYKGGDAEMNEVKSPFMQQSPGDGADLISRQAAIECVGWGDSVTAVISRIKLLPNVQPDQQRGEWIEVEVFPEVYDIDGVKTWGSEMQCDQCGFRHTAIEGHMTQHNFCPSCGARMYKGGEDDADE